MNCRLEQAPCLYSQEEFAVWYLSRFDFTMFSKEDVSALLCEVRPENYPCIPMIRKGELEVLSYEDPAFIENWSAALNTTTLSLHCDI